MNNIDKLLKLSEIEIDLRKCHEKLKKYEEIAYRRIEEEPMFNRRFRFKVSKILEECKKTIEHLEKLKTKILDSLTVEERLIYEVGGYE